MSWRNPKDRRNWLDDEDRSAAIIYKIWRANLGPGVHELVIHDVGGVDTHTLRWWPAGSDRMIKHTLGADELGLANNNMRELAIRLAAEMRRKVKAA